MHRFAADIRERHLTREQLLDISNRRLTEGNSAFSHVLGDTADLLMRRGQDFRSFTRGATLGLHLIDVASECGAPVIDVASAELASQYINQFPELEDLKLAMDDGLLAGQESLSKAFDEAFAGMPEDTERDMARLGAGITTFGMMIAVQSTGEEIWFGPTTDGPV